MRRWLVVLLFLLTSVAVVALIAALRFNTYLDDNRGVIAEQASAALGRDVALGGISVSLRGGIGIRLTDVAIGDDPAYGGEPFVSAGAVEVRLRVLPLLRGVYDVRRIVFERPVVRIVRTDAGLNVSTFAASATTEPGAQPTAVPALAVALFNIADGTIDYFDRTVDPPVRLVVEELSLKASDLDPASAMRFELTAHSSGDEKARVRASGALGPFVQEAPDRTPVEVSMTLEVADVAAAARIPFVAQALESAPQLTGPASLSAEVAGTLASARVQALIDATETRVLDEGRFDKPAGTQLVMQMTAARSADGVTIEDGRVRLAGQELTIGGRLGSGATAAYELSLGGSDLSLAALAALLPPLAEANVDGRASPRLTLSAPSQPGGAARLSGTVQLVRAGLRMAGRPRIEEYSTVVTIDGTAVDVPSAALKVGGVPVEVSVALDDAAALTGRFSLSAAALPPARLLDPEVAPRDGEDVLRDVAVDGRLRRRSGALAVDAAVRSAAGVIAGVAYSGLRGTLAYEDATAKLDPLTFSVFGGNVRAAGTYAVGAEHPAPFSLQATVEGVRVGDAVATARSGLGELISGVFDGDVSVSGAGSDWATIRKVLRGAAQVQIRDGMLKDVNIADGLLYRVSGVPGLDRLLSPSLRAKYPGMFSSGGTQFQKLVASLRIVDGMMRSDNLSVAAADYGLKAAGAVGLDGSVDVTGTFLPSNTLASDLISAVSLATYLRGSSGAMEIPFSVKGTLPGVRVVPDADFLTRSLQKAVVGNVEQLLEPGLRILRDAGSILGGDRATPKAGDGVGKPPSKKDAPQPGAR